MPSLLYRSSVVSVLPTPCHYYWYRVYAAFRVSTNSCLAMASVLLTASIVWTLSIKGFGISPPPYSFMVYLKDVITIDPLWLLVLWVGVICILPLCFLYAPWSVPCKRRLAIFYRGLIPKMLIYANSFLFQYL